MNVKEWTETDRNVPTGGTAAVRPQRGVVAVQKRRQLVLVADAPGDFQMVTGRITVGETVLNFVFVHDVGRGRFTCVENGGEGRNVEECGGM